MLWAWAGRLAKDPRRSEEAGSAASAGAQQVQSHGLLAGVQHRNGRMGSFRTAMEVGANEVRLKEALKDLNQGFWASSTLAVKRTRRDEVCKLAQIIAPGGKFLPLSKEVVEASPAALKAAKLASAEAEADACGGGVSAGTMVGQDHSLMQEVHGQGEGSSQEGPGSGPGMPQGGPLDVSWACCSAWRCVGLRMGPMLDVEGN